MSVLVLIDLKLGSVSFSDSTARMYTGSLAKLESDLFTYYCRPEIDPNVYTHRQPFHKFLRRYNENNDDNGS